MIVPGRATSPKDVHNSRSRNLQSKKLSIKISNKIKIQRTSTRLPEDGLDLEVGVGQATSGADHAGGERAAHTHIADELVDVGRQAERHGAVRVKFPAHIVHVELEEGRKNTMVAIFK